MLRNPKKAKKHRQYRMHYLHAGDLLAPPLLALRRMSRPQSLFPGLLRLALLSSRQTNHTAVNPMQHNCIILTVTAVSHLRSHSILQGIFCKTHNPCEQFAPSLANFFR